MTLDIWARSSRPGSVSVGDRKPKNRPIWFHAVSNRTAPMGLSRGRCNATVVFVSNGRRGRRLRSLPWKATDLPIPKGQGRRWVTGTESSDFRSLRYSSDRRLNRATDLLNITVNLRPFFVHH